MQADNEEVMDVTAEIEPDAVDNEQAVSLPDAFANALNSMKGSTAAFVMDGDREDHGHQSGEPVSRSFVPAEEDPRDVGLQERIVAEDVVYTGRIFNVDRLQVKLPDGRDGLRDVVRHPGAVAIVALTDDGRICLVRQYRAALGRVTVEIPAGKLDPGEDPLDCAMRELEEETGMRAERMAFLTTIATADGFCDELIHFYMARGLSFAQSNPDADEFINVDLVDLSELIDAVLDGKVEDAKTVVGALICDAVARRLAPEE
jgi:ADP-ribose pyrophosphatase